MLNLIKPKMLKPGNKVATVSLSWGGAGDEEILWRYKQGKERLENVFGHHNTYYDEYKDVINKILKEYNREDMPVLYNLNFGHTEPKICLPYGALAQIDSENKTFSILENAVE